MSLSQFGRLYAKLAQIDELIHNLYVGRMSLTYNIMLDELFTLLTTFTGQRPTSMSDVKSAMETFARDFFEYLQRGTTQKRMGHISYLLENDDAANVLEAAIDPFVIKYLSDRSANNMTESDEIITTSLLARTPFKQGAMSPRDTLLRIAMRRPNLIGRMDGHITVNPDCVCTRSGGWITAMIDIQKIPSAATSTVYVSSDSVYFVFKNSRALKIDDNFSIDLPVGLENLHFFGKVELVNAVDDRTIGMKEGFRAFMNSDGVLPGFQIDNDGLGYTIGTKREWSFRLGVRLRLGLTGITQFPSDVSTIAFRMKGRFYLTPCRMRELTEFTHRDFGSPDSWNFVYDSLHLNMLLAPNDCQGSVMREATAAFSFIVNSAIKSQTKPGVQPFNAVFHTFSDIGEVISVLNSASENQMDIPSEYRSKIMDLAVTVSIMFSVCLSRYVQG